MASAADGIRWLRQGLQLVEGRHCMHTVLAEQPPPSSAPALLALGKAAPAMLLGALQYLTRHGLTPGTVLGVTKGGHWMPWRSEIQALAPAAILLEGSHPLPDEASLLAGEALHHWADVLPVGQPVWVMLSGGASALVERLVPGMNLAEWQALNHWLLSGGWSIHRINRVRAQFSQIKGGGLARLLSPRPVRAFVLSDVPGNDLDVIASAPLRPMPLPEPADWAALPARWRDRVQPQAKVCPRVPHVLVGDNARWLQAVAEVSEAPLQVETETFSGPLEAIVHRLAQAEQPLLIGGEATVTLPADVGLGGRNQHLALWMARLLAGTDGWCVALGSDGTDGPTDAAGGWADGQTWQRLQRAGRSPEQALARFDSHGALKAIGQTIETGPTGTNVMDAVLYWPPSTALMRSRVRSSAP
ncbi:DUF4147 domain-containing protein [Sulfurivirga sp.]|uniref:glycerate kinase type-2 family protein n=1 Tax=Sulfurivirga sp. TaxID=2614236 RepID=UPI0025D06C4B|nr:DUF4147 domain-containing protein [Sulfurivirga sp.]